MVLGAAVLFGMYMRFIERPASKVVAGYKSQIRNSQMQLKDLETKKPQDAQISLNVEELGAKQKALSEEITKLEEQMPSQFNTSQLIGHVTNLAKEVRLESVKQRVVKDQSYLRIFLEIKFYSNYPDAIRYIAAVEAISPFIRVEEMEILEPPTGKAVELGGAPVKLTVSCLLGDTSPDKQLKPGTPAKLDLKRDILSSASKPTEELSDAKFTLEGITFDARNPTAIVNGDVYATGAKLGPYTVKKILSDSVILSDGVEDHTLSLRPTEVLKK